MADGVFRLSFHLGSGLIISIRQKDGIIAKAVGSAGLRSALQTAAKENPDRRIRLDGDIYAPFRSIVQVLDTCQQERLTVVGIHTADGLKK